MMRAMTTTDAPIKLLVNTNQEAFDTAARHLLSLRGRSATPEGTCVYRGKACAVGCLIPAESRESLDDRPYSGIRNLVRDGLVHPGDVDVSLLAVLQSAHDGEDRWEDTKFIGLPELERIAKYFSLSTDGLQEALSETPA